MITTKQARQRTKGTSAPADAETPVHVAVVLAAITAVMLIMMVTLLAAGPIMRLIGDKVEAVITRILGVILAALAAQFVIDGLKQSFPHVLG